MMVDSSVQTYQMGMHTERTQSIRSAKQISSLIMCKMNKNAFSIWKNLAVFVCRDIGMSFLNCIQFDVARIQVFRSFIWLDNLDIE